jgi:predicted small metal-binding protein
MRIFTAKSSAQFPRYTASGKLQAYVFIFKMCILSGWIEVSKRFACSDLGMACRFKIRASTEDELMSKITEHAREVHSIMTMDAPTLAAVRAAIKEE